MPLLDFLKREPNNNESIIGETKYAILVDELRHFDDNHARVPTMIVEPSHYKGPMVLKQGIKGTSESWRLYSHNGSKLNPLIDLSALSELNRANPDILQAKVDMGFSFSYGKSGELSHIVTILSEDILFLDTIEKTYKSHVADYRRCAR